MASSSRTFTPSGIFISLLRRLARPIAGAGRAYRSLAPPGVGDGEPDLRSIGLPEDEVDAATCLAKGEVLLRAGHGGKAQRFFRQAPRLAPSRRSASAVTLRCAGLDFEFLGLIEKADRARAAAKWREAGDLYAAALDAYPDHAGYIVQYAHCLKEREQFAEAECHYRSALALGAPGPDVDEHLAFVVTRQDDVPLILDAERQLPAGDGDPLDMPPTKRDVELVFFMLLGRKPSLAETVRLLRGHPLLRSLVMEVVEENAFGAANPGLVSSLGHRSASADLPGKPEA
jgi:tetratricopeptide (TPR) repeat protein